MGTLRALHNGEDILLRSRTLVGRSRVCDLRVQDRAVSGEHAMVVWDRGAWAVRDLGSRNGTFVDGQRVRSGESHPVPAGAALAFGGGDQRFELVDDQGPVPFAVRESDGIRAIGVGDLLGIPDLSEPSVTLYRDPRGFWVVERDGETTYAEDREVVEVGDDRWDLSLPEVLQGTMDADDVVLSVNTARARFVVSRDQEHVELSLHLRGGRSVELKPRTHHQLLALLAQVRLDDQARGDLAPADCGWMYQDELCKALGAKSSKVNIDIFRARKQLADVGVVDAANVVERRQGVGQLRLGFHDIEVIYN